MKANDPVLLEKLIKDSEKTLNNKKLSQKVFDIPRNSNLNSEPEFPVELLPEWLSKISYEHADSYGTPVELWAMSFLSGISTAVGKKFRMITGNYTNYPQIWLMIVGASGTGKSEPLKVAYKPILARDKEKYLKYQAEYQEWEAEKSGKQPRWAQTCINDTTPEALYSVLKHSENGLTLFRDELSGFFQDIGRYSSSGEVGHYLSMFDNTTFSVSRVKNTPLFIDEPLLNISGTIQPGILPEIMKKNSADHVGFSQRFLYMFPEFPPRNYKPSTVNLSTSLYDAYIQALLDINETAETKMTDDAEQLYAVFFNEMEVKRAESDDYWASIYSKAQIQVLRIALTIFISRMPENPVNEVQVVDMDCAIGIMRYFLHSIKKIRPDAEKTGITKKELVNEIIKANPEISQSRVAELLNVSRQYVNKVVVDRLTVDNVPNTVIDGNTENNAVNQDILEKDFEKNEVDTSINAERPDSRHYEDVNLSTCQPRVGNHLTMDEAVKIFQNNGFDIVASYGR